MKKKKIKGNLQLNKNVISKLDNRKLLGGIEISERRTNCDMCPPPPTNTTCNTCAQYCNYTADPNQNCELPPDVYDVIR